MLSTSRVCDGGDALLLERRARSRCAQRSTLSRRLISAASRTSARDLEICASPARRRCARRRPPSPARCGRPRWPRGPRSRRPRRPGCARSRGRGSPRRWRCARRRALFSCAMRAASIGLARAAMSASSSARVRSISRRGSPARRRCARRRASSRGRSAQPRSPGGPRSPPPPAPACARSRASRVRSSGDALRVVRRLEDAQLLGRLARGDPASSTARVRSISRRRVSSSCAMRASATRLLLGDARPLDRLARRRCGLPRLACWLDIGRRTSRSLAMRASLSACSWRMRAVSISSRAAISAASMACCARSRAGGFRPRRRCAPRRSPARWRSAPARSPRVPRSGPLGLGVAHGALAGDMRPAAGRGGTRSRAPARAAPPRSRARCRALCFSASRLRVRIAIIESCSMSLRSLRRVLDLLDERVRPSASKRLDGLKNSRSVWSMSMMATDSSSSPFWARSSCRDLLHAGDIVAALLVHLVHGHLGGGGAQRLELAGEQRVQAFLAPGCGGRGSRRRSRPPRGAGDADVELGLDVDAHAVAGDQRLLAPRGPPRAAACSC